MSVMVLAGFARRVATGARCDGDWEIDMASKQFVLVVRHPDYANEITTDGDIEVIDIDLGSSFYGSPDSEQDALEWAENLEVWLAHVPSGSPVFAHAVETVAGAVERYAQASAWVDAYVARRKGES